MNFQMKSPGSRFTAALLLAGLVLAAAVGMSSFVPSGAVAAPAKTKYAYHVCRNDTVRSVADLLGVDEQDLRRWNRRVIRGDRFARNVQGIVYYAARPYAQESVGRPNAGSLVGGVNLDCDGDDRGAGWIINTERTQMYGTPETVRNIRMAAKAYRNYFAGRGIRYVPLAIGNLSKREGGPIPPHHSHESGRDVDVGIILVSGNTPGHFSQATSRNIDSLRTWVMMKSFLDTGDVQYIFMHRNLVASMKQFVQRIYAGDRRKLGRYMQAFRSGIIQGDDEHSSHIHVRFKCPRGDRRCIQ